jgi:hypothetical protein
MSQDKPMRTITKKILIVSVCGVLALFFFVAKLPASKAANPVTCSESGGGAPDVPYNFTASDGSGSYTWSAPYSSTSTGSGPSFTTSYKGGSVYTTITYSAQVNDGAMVATCGVKVMNQGPPPSGYPQPAYISGYPTPNPAQVTAGTPITISGNLSGFGIENDCGQEGDGKYKWNGAHPASASYDVDSVTGGGISLQQTQVGTVFGCTLNPPALKVDKYSYSFTIDTTGLLPGTHNIDIHITPVEGEASADTYVPFTVLGGGGGGSATGTVSVTSQNAVTNAPLSTSWDFEATDQNGYPITDPCVSEPCSNINGGTYTNSELGTWTLNPTTTPPTGYVLESVKEQDIAQVQNPFVAFFTGIVRQADAYTLCGFANGGDPTCPLPSNSLLLATSSGVSSPTANFTIEWAPVGTLDVTAPPGLTSSNPSAQMGLADRNGTPGSSVDDLSIQNIDYGSGPSGWLSIGSLSGIILNQGAAATDVTVTATSLPSGCSSGCTAQVRLQGSSPGDPNQIYSSIFNVTLDTSGNGNGGYTVSVSPATTSVETNATQQFTAMTTDPAGVNWTLSGLGCSGAACGTVTPTSSLTGVPITYMAPTTVPNPATVTITATTPDGTASNFGTITVTAPQAPPTVSLNVSPPVINLGNSATLSWSTTGANSCAASALPVQSYWSGTETLNNSGLAITPGSTGLITYKLTCNNGAGSASSTAALQVIGCTIGAYPTSVVVPGTSVVSADCEAVPANYVCTLTGSDGTNDNAGLSLPPGNVSANWTVAPATNTQYTIACTDPNNDATASATVPVTVSNPGTGECPPQGCTP